MDTLTGQKLEQKPVGTGNAEVILLPPYPDLSWHLIVEVAFLFSICGTVLMLMRGGSSPLSVVLATFASYSALLYGLVRIYRFQRVISAERQRVITGEAERLRKQVFTVTDWVRRTTYIQSAARGSSYQPHAYLEIHFSYGGEEYRYNCSETLLKGKYPSAVRFPKASLTDPLPGRQLHFFAPVESGAKKNRAVFQPGSEIEFVDG